MKKLIGILALILILSGCGGTVTIKDARESDDFTTDRLSEVTQTNIDGYRVYILKDNETSCQYIMTTGKGTSIEPMIGLDGKPHCPQN